MINNKNSSHLKSSFHSDEFDDQRTSRWFHQNCCRLLFVLILTLLSIGTTTFLVILLYKDTLKEKLLVEKRKSWVVKWKMLEPYVKKFPLGFVLGFIRNLIVLAIERQI